MTRLLLLLVAGAAALSAHDPLDEDLSLSTDELSLLGNEETETYGLTEELEGYDDADEAADDEQAKEPLDHVAKEAEEDAENADDKIEALKEAETAKKEAQVQFEAANGTLYQCEEDFEKAHNTAEELAQEFHKASNSSTEAKQLKEESEKKLAELLQAAAVATAAVAEKHQELLVAHEALLEANQDAEGAFAVASHTLAKVKEQLLYTSKYADRSMGYADQALGDEEFQKLPEVHVDPVPDMPVPNVTAPLEVKLPDASGKSVLPKLPCQHTLEDATKNATTEDATFAQKADGSSSGSWFSHAFG